VPRQLSPYTPQEARFRLQADCGLVSHYPPGKVHDSMLEQAFAERWAHTRTAWRLEREVDLIPLPGSVMVPDFRLVHPDGRSFLLEIVGYWRPEYLRKKFAQVRRAGRHDLILAISERLNLERAGPDLPACGGLRRRAGGAGDGKPSMPPSCWSVVSGEKPTLPGFLIVSSLKG
jgi:predicted nuclease of restriction endonuclease-like RecB superfamily